MIRSSLKWSVPVAMLAAGCTLAAAQSQLAPSSTDNTVHPITSLPKAPDDPSNPATHPQPVAAAAATAQPATEASQPASATPSAAQPAADAMPAVAVASPAATQPSAPAVPVAPPPAPVEAMVPAPPPPPARLVRSDVRPFRTFGASVNVGVGGVGVQLATPLSRTTNFRVGGDFLGLSKTFIENGLHYAGDLKFRTANANLDWFPFHGGFRISPGLTLYNGNNLDASVTAPGGQMFSLAGQQYTSSPSDPVTGTASLSFGNRVAPQITTGFGNMIPRSGRHFSVPFEIGFQYVGQPLIQIHLQGTACTTYMGVYTCDNAATDPQIQANVQQEQNELNADIHQLRFYPILRLGLSYKF